MRFSISAVAKYPFRIILIFILSTGFLLVQSSAWTKVYAQQEPTASPTETRIRLVSVGGYCGPDLGKLNLQLQRQVINATRSLKGTLCGRLVILNDFKTKIDYLGLMPCTGGGPYIFKTRPRELLNYYQLINVKFENGKTIRVEGYGELSKYIKNFDTYYPMVDCNGCGYLPGYAPVSTQSEFIFPGSAPTATPAPLLSQAQVGVMSIQASGSNGFLSSDFIFPTPTSAFNMSDSTLAPLRTPTPTATSDQLSLIVERSTHTPSPSSTAKITPSPANSRTPVRFAGVINKTKPPLQPPFGVLGYSLYTFLLVPPIVFWILWRRARLG